VGAGDGPYFQDPSLGLVQRLVSLAYPVGDVLLLALAARLATSPGRRTAAFRLLVASLIVTMAADTLFSVLSLSGASVAVTDGMYLVDYLLLGAAGLHPSMAGLLEPARRRQARLGRGRLLAMGAAALVAPALLVVERLRGNDLQVTVIAGAWAVLFLLVMGRMAGLVRGIERAEGERRRVLDRAVQAAEQERMHVATELHDGPSSAWPCSPTTWSGPSSGCLATRRRWPGSSTPRPPSRPRSRGCGS
jgi:signal transduction histidine kinase